MPPKDYEPSQIFLKAEDREYKPIGNAVELTDEGKIELVEFMKSYLKVFRNMERLLKCTFWCNNWRKMHHLPLIRRRGKRK